MIKIDKELKYNGGFTSSECVLKITSYSIQQTKQFQASGITESTVINYQLYKSLSDYNAGENAVHSINFPHTISVAQTLNDETIEAAVIGFLNDKGFPAELIEGE